MEAARLVASTPDTWEKIVKTSSYVNFGIDHSVFSQGLVYHDDQSGLIQWQRDSIATPWHRKWTRSSWTTGGVTTLKFDCLAGNRDHGSDRLKATILRKIGNANGSAAWEYEGNDYKGRRIQLTPITQWARIQGTASWRRIAEWQTETHSWLEID